MATVQSIGLARKVGLPTSTVARLLATLEGCHAVERNPDGTGYRIGSSIVTMATSADPTQSLLAVAQPHIATTLLAQPQ